MTTHTFACYPSALDDSFDSFLIDVPALTDSDTDLQRAARRAWWTCFHQLGPRGFEPEQFSVCRWTNGRPGQVVTAGGLVDLYVAS